jgi:hypothetical protein
MNECDRRESEERRTVTFEWWQVGEGIARQEIAGLKVSQANLSQVRYGQPGRLRLLY